VVPPKIARKFKKASLSKKDSIHVQADEELVQKGKRVKRSAKKSSTTPAAGIVFRETLVKTKSTGKEKVDVSRGKVAEKPPNVEKITPTVTSERTGHKPGVPDVTEDDSTESESESWEQDEESDDDNQEEEEVDQENEFEDDEIESDEDKGRDDTTDQFDDDVDARLEEPTQTETTQEQVVDDAHVTITTVTKKTEVPITSSSRSSDLASKFLNFSDIPQTDVEIVYPLDVHVHHEILRSQAPTLLTIPVSVITESSPSFVDEVAKLKKDPLHTQVTTLVDEHLETRLGETREEFMNFLSESLTARIKEQVKDQLPQILPKEVSNFAPPVIEKLIKESRDEVTLGKVSSKPQSTYEATSTHTEFELKKILLDKMKKSESYLTAPEHRDCYDGLKKSYTLDKDFFYSYDVYSLKHGRKDKDKDEDPSAGSDRGLKKRKLSKDAEPTTEEPVFEVADSNMPQDQEGNLGDNEDEPRNETASRRDWFKKPTPP
ncbi:hypothetical protein Tco_0545791, partial [Tanacetum coccineum]